MLFFGDLAVTVYTFPLFGQDCVYLRSTDSPNYLTRDVEEFPIL